MKPYSLKYAPNVVTKTTNTDRFRNFVTKKFTETCTQRSHNFEYYYIEQTNNDVFKLSYFLRAIREWNNLPSDIVSSTTIDLFQKKLGFFLRED